MPATQDRAGAHDPAREHQHRDRGEAAGEADPDADALPVAAEGQPGADAEADAPIAEQGEDQRPARVVEPAQHARADHLRAVDQLERGGDAQEADGERR